MEHIIIKEINGFKLFFHEDEPLFKEDDENKNKLIQEWIGCHKGKSINRKYTSYRIKHMCEKELGFYVSNADIKYNMAMLDIEGVVSDCLYNYYYPFK